MEKRVASSAFHVFLCSNDKLFLSCQCSLQQCSEEKNIFTDAQPNVLPDTYAGVAFAMDVSSCKCMDRRGASCVFQVFLM